MAAVAQFDSVGLRYGTGAEVLRDLDFRLRTGAFYFLTGPSGAGKTSLLKLLYLAQRPTRGRISLFGEELSEAEREALPPFRRRIGVVFQDFRLIRHLSAFDNVALPLRIAGARPPTPPRSRPASPAPATKRSKGRCGKCSPGSGLPIGRARGRRRCLAGSSSAWRSRAR